MNKTYLDMFMNTVLAQEVIRYPRVDTNTPLSKHMNKTYLNMFMNTASPGSYKVSMHTNTPISKHMNKTYLNMSMNTVLAHEVIRYPYTLIHP